jgi:hypothetical protein
MHTLDEMDFNFIEDLPVRDEPDMLDAWEILNVTPLCV